VSGIRSNQDLPEPTTGTGQLTGFGSSKGLPLTLRIPAWPPAVSVTSASADSPLGASVPKPPLHDAVGGRSKRLIDVAIAGAVLLSISPMLVLVALCLRVTLGTPILFAQRRVGFGGRPFNCYKFRTMVLDGEQILHRHLKNNPQAAQEWRETQKLKNDPRVTRFSRLLRKSSIDELPQLFNVLRGDMSCVGPRPIVPAEIERYQGSACEYMTARPGLTGLWQVSGRNRLSYSNRVALDRFYVRQWSLVLDLAILLRTITAVMRWDETS
jgi:exopolysaccharide production protein ExoY